MATQDTQDTQATLRKIAEREQAEAAAPEALVEKFDVTEAKPKRTRKTKPNGKSIVRLDADGQPVGRVRAEPDPDPPAAEAKPKRTRKTKPAPEAPKPEPVEEGRNAFQWPKSAASVLLDYLSARVSAEFDPEHPARPYINSNGKLFVHSTDWRDWLLENGLAPSKSEAAKPLRDNVGVVRATPLPGMDKALGFYQGPALPGTEGLPRRESRAASGPRAPRNPLSALNDEQRVVVTKALMMLKPGRTAEGKRLADVRDELLALLP